MTYRRGGQRTRSGPTCPAPHHLGVMRSAAAALLLAIAALPQTSRGQGNPMDLMRQLQSKIAQQQQVR